VKGGKKDKTQKMHKDLHILFFFSNFAADFNPAIGLNGILNKGTIIK